MKTALGISTENRSELEVARMESPGSSGYDCPANIAADPEASKEWIQVVDRVRPFAEDPWWPKLVVEQPSPLERVCLQVLAEQLGLNWCLPCEDEGVMLLSKPSQTDHQVRRLLLQYSLSTTQKVLQFPELDQFELHCVETQVGMLGLGTQFHDADNQLSRLSVSKQPSSSEDSEERKEVSSEQQHESCRKMCRNKSLSRLSSSLKRSESFSSREALFGDNLRDNGYLARIGILQDCREIEQPAAQCTGAVPIPLPVPAGAVFADGKKKFALHRIESQRVINQSALLSSSLENTSFGLEPKQENVWYLQEPSADSITDTIAVFKSDSSEDVLTSTQDLVQGRSGFAQGQSHNREVAAYKLDHKAWAGVPATINYQTSIGGSNIEGSVQSFIEHDHSADEDDENNENGRNDYRRYPYGQVHRVGLLDIRLFNTDRHGGNLLVRGRGEDVSLIPIDHGLCLPDWKHLQMPTQPVWLMWEQAEIPFDKEVCSYVENLDLDADSLLLRKSEIEPESIVTFTLCHALMKGAVIGMKPCSYTLSDLGELVVQHTIDMPSTFSSWIQSAPVQEADSVVEWFNDNHLRLLTQHIATKMQRQYRIATNYVQGALDRELLQLAIESDRFGLDKSSQNQLALLLHDRGQLPSAAHSQLSSEEQMAECTREQLAQLREQVVQPWWKFATSLAEIGKRVGYQSLDKPF